MMDTMTNIAAKTNFRIGCFMIAPWFGVVGRAFEVSLSDCAILGTVKPCLDFNMVLKYLAFVNSFALDGSLIGADANKHRSILGRAVERG